MQVKQRLRITTLLSVATALTIVLLLVVAFYRINKAANASNLAGKIVAGAFERAAFRNDYISTNSDRAKEQWFAKHEQIGGLIESAYGQFTDAKDIKTLNELRKSHDAIKRIFSDIVKNREKERSSARTSFLSSDVEDRLRGQIHMRVYEVALHGRNLQESANAALLHTFRVTGIEIFSVLVLVSALTLSNSWTMGRAITARILRLSEGALVIGEGHLDHRIDIKGNDEFAALADAFNTMTSKLGDAYHNLEKEMKERKQAEEEASRGRKIFSELIDRSPFGTYVVDGQFRIAMMNASSQEGAFRNVRPLIGHDFAEAMRILWPEPVAAEIIGHFRHTLDTGEPYYSRDFIRPRSDVEIVEAYEWELHRVILPDGQYGVICYYFDSTKLREAEEALRRSEARWNAAIENFGEGAIIATEDEQVIYWNPAAMAMHGFKSENEGIEPLEETPKTFELWTPDGKHLLELDEWPMRRIKRGEAVRNLELRLRRPDQNWEKIVAYSGAMIEIARGERLIFLSVYDLTEQRRAEAALHENEERFRTLANAMPQLAWMAQPDGYIVWYNQRWYQYTGTTPEQMTGWGWQSVHDPVELPEVLERWKASIATGEPFEMTFPLLGADGVFRLFLTRGFPLKDGDGRVVQWFGTNTDVTALKQAEESLRESEEKYRNLFENMAEEVHFWQIVRDEAGRIKTWRLVDVNPPSLKSWGRRTVEEIRGKTTDEIFGPGATEHYMPIVRKIMTEGIPYSYEDYFPNLDKYFRFTSVPFEDFFITTGADITVIKKAEAAVKQSLAEKEVLLKEIHHRVKNNMQVISSLVSLQAGELQDAAMRDILDEVTHRIRSMALVHEKLYQSEDLSQIDFAEYAKSLLGYLWRAYGTAASDIRLTTEAEQVSLTVNTAVPCGLILNELVSNALKHAFRGCKKGEVTVSIHKSQGMIRLSVRDNGNGLPAEFDWRRANSLGLRLVQMLAGQLHADVEVNSEGGTEFTVTFGKPEAVEDTGYDS